MEITPYSEMICEFLDGELDIVGEEALFCALAAAPELRSEMREYLSIRSAVQSHAEAFSPPIDAANTIFNNVGLEYHFDSSSALKKRGFRLFWNRYGRTAAIALLISFITGGAVSLWYENTVGDILAARHKAIPNKYTVAVLQSNHSVDEASLSANNRLIEKKTTNIKQHYNATNNNVYNTNSTEFLQKNIAVESDLKHGDGNSALIENIGNLTQNNKHYNTAEMNMLSTTEIIASDAFKTTNLYPQFWLQARGIATISSSISPLPKAGVSFFDNMAISGYYKLSSSFALGAEIGREHYPLQYGGKFEGVDVQYRQTAPLLYGGITAQYEMEPLKNFGDISPYASMSAGGTEIGPFVRGTIGIFYPLSQNFGMTFGGDMSAVFFQFQERSFHSLKSGLSYGFAFQF